MNQKVIEYKLEVYSMDEMTLGNYLRNLRNKKNVTTRELGDLIGYSYSYIASIETGKRKPREAVVEKYIYQLAYNSEELKKIKIDICNITNGEYYKNYLVNYDDSDSKNNTIKNDIDSMIIKENSELSKKFYNFPINDIFYHLNDKYNSKFFDGMKLSDSDRRHIIKLISSTLMTSLENDVNFTESQILLKKDNIYKLEKDYNQAKEEYQSIINDDAEKRKLEIHIEVYKKVKKELYEELSILINEKEEKLSKLKSLQKYFMEQ